MTDTAARQQLDPLEALCEQYALPSIDLSAFAPQQEAIKLVHHSIARKLRVLPLSRVGSVLTVVMAEPNLSTVDALRFATGYCVETILAPADELDAAITRFYQLDEPQIEIEAERPVVETSYPLKSEATAAALIASAMNSPHVRTHIALRGNVHRGFYVGSIDEVTDYAAAIEAALKAVGK
jgi:Type II secretion system (T2SS), protein E, N-terminal domain